MIIRTTVTKERLLKREIQKYFDTQLDSACNEKKIQNTVQLSKSAFAACEAETPVSHLEFLCQQSRYIQKRWWLLQAFLLATVNLFLSLSESTYHVRRSLGVAAPLFVILFLPELWKNRNANATEIECTTYFSLRLIYSARLTLFAVTDLLLITLFVISTAFTAQLTLWEILIQFFLPFNVSCCICFGSFYKSKYVSEACSILLCAVWTALWILVILNDAVYNTISAPLWAFMTALSFWGTGYSICRGQTKLQEFHQVYNGGKTIWN